MKKTAITFFISILALGLLSACGTSEKSSGNGAGGDNKDDKELVMGTSADYAPFEYVDTENGDEIIGFDIDLANLLAEELGYTVKVKDIEFNGLIAAIQAGQVDFVMSGMTPTEDRKKNVDFSDVYYTARNMIVAKKGSGIKTVEDLDGKKLGVQLASIQEDEAEEIGKTVKITVENRNRIPELIQEIKAGRIDAAIIEDTVAKGYFDNNPDLEGFNLPESEEAGSAIAFPKDSKLTEEFNKVLKEKMENGEVDKLVVKWFGGEK
ncbi:transporter substrate-binding domain-containing protein [Bacillus sp. T33-2]|uniref:transporter substrate-binding domain-containing protein n=1 Tax=Bacillus sp. T33-2 TaxID=2054168 RepID=UPI000C783358|nr:transporter substrate-binding domain-containing protein [Bacillus sp. T33-2]PLR99853.1 ABC transporter substrate-binding protein [Bacillus sp. T33-2]